MVEDVQHKPKRQQGDGAVKELTLVGAINQALIHEMEQDERVVVLGEDVGSLGGVFRVTQGLAERFGIERVVDTPLSELGIVGASIGMALYGLRPVAEVQFADYIYPAFDQIVNEAAKFRYRSGGEFTCPLVIRAPSGGGIRGGHYHSQSPEALFAHVPGLTVVMPATPHDAKGLLLSAIRSEDPVLFFEPKRIYRAVRGEVPQEEYLVPLGKAHVVREGDDVTLVTWGAMLYESLAAAHDAEQQGVHAEVIDLRTIWPMDVDTVISSVKKTGRMVVVHEAPRTCGFGAEVVSTAIDHAFVHLEAPPLRITGWDTPFPYSLESEYLPLQHRILPALLQTARYA